MTLHEFNFSMDERFLSIDDVPDQRNDVDKVFSPLSIYNHLKPDIGYAERAAEEYIHVSGAWTTIFVRTENNSADDVWEEDSDPTYRNGVKLKGWFKPEPFGIELTKWGVDSPLQLTVVYARSEILNAFKIDRMLRPGDVIELPYNAIGTIKINKFRIMDAHDMGNFHYRWLYTECLCENITDDKALKLEHK